MLLTLLIIILALVFFAIDRSDAAYTMGPVNPTYYGFSCELTWDDTVPPVEERYYAPISPLLMQVYYVFTHTVRIKIIDPANQRWEVPDIVQVDMPDTPTPNLEYLVEVPERENGAFGLSIIRLSDGEDLLDLRTSFYFSDQFIEFTTTLPQDPYLFGLGERVTTMRLPLDKKLMMFATDHPTPYEKPLYGTHPFYMEMRNQGAAHGVFWLNSNAQDFEINAGQLTWRSVGGIVDLFVFVGPGPEVVTQQYQNIIGTPWMIPYWSLGFHQCRWGYPTIQDVEEVVYQYRAHDIPLEVMWIDIDHMQDYKIFTLDPVRFPQEEVRSFVASLHAEEQRLVLIVDPAVKIQANYSTYESGLERGVYVMDNEGVEPQTAKVWPILTTVPDFTSAETIAWWADEMAAFHDIVPYDGMWTDMNECASFCDGRCVLIQAEEENPDQDLFSCACTNMTTSGLPWNFPNYMPGNPGDRPERSGKVIGLDQSSLDMASRYAGGIEYDIHSLFGHLEAAATASALTTILNQRPFVLTRSSFPGTGRIAGHWLGDNDSTWAALAQSVAGMMTMNIFGIPYVGADICGFMNNSDEELCGRWMQLGVWSPFARNHNGLGNIPQEPYVWPSPVPEISRDFILHRYSMNALYYTLFHRVHVLGGTVIRPLFFEFPDQPQLWATESQFMIGEYVIVTPVTAAGVTSMTYNLPSGSKWYNFYTGVCECDSVDGCEITQAITRYDFPMHIRGGYIMYKQTPAYTTAETKRNPMQLYVALNNQEDAPLTGQLFLDNGQSIDNLDRDEFLQVYFQATEETTGLHKLTITSTVAVNGYPTYVYFDTIIILGWHCSKVGDVTVDGNNILDGDAPAVIHTEEEGVTSFANLRLPISTAFSMVAECKKSSVDGGHGGGDSDDSGLPDYAIALIVVASSFAALAVGLVGYRKYRAMTKWDEGMSRSLINK